MSQYFKKVGIVSRLQKDRSHDSLRTLIASLQPHTKVLVEKKTAKILQDNHLLTANAKELVTHCDLIITVGGDGNLLGAARLAAPHEIPIVGINRGRFGFLTDIFPDEINKQIGEILNGKFQEEQRIMLDVKIEYQQKYTYQGLALNDIILTPSSSSHMLSFDIDVNDDFMCREESDGLIVATPTGSTAYALSGGGPILHPQLNVMLMVPMFPHTLSHRPIVLSDDSYIKIRIPEKALYLPRVSCDGQAYADTRGGSIIHIRKAEKPLRLIHPLNYNYFRTLREKLYWGKSLVTKS